MRLQENIAYEKAKERVQKLKGFYIHLFVYVVVNAIIISSQVVRGESWDNLQMYYTAIFWGIGILAHAISVVVPALAFTQRWEERKIKEIMEKEKQKNF